MSRSIRPSALLFAIGIAACSAQLPSERPLGLGPLARQPLPPEPSGGPVTMPGGAQQMQFESDEDEDDNEGDSTAENDKPAPPSKDTPDAGVTSMSDAGPAPSTPSSTAPTAVLDFTGDYSGKDVTTFRYSSARDDRMEDPKAKTSVKKAGDALAITIVDSGSGDPICTLKASQKGDIATLAPGQECAEPQSPFLRGKLTRGQAKLQSKQLTLDMSFEVNLNVRGKQITTVEYHFEGTRR